MTVYGVGPGETRYTEPDKASISGMPIITEGDEIILQLDEGIWINVGEIRDINPRTRQVDITVYCQPRVVEAPDWAK